MQDKNMITMDNLRYAKRHVLKDVIPLNMPYSIYIEPASSCNFNCVQCFQSNEEYKAKNNNLILPMELFNKIIDEIKDWVKMEGKVKAIKLYGLGEPFLNRNYPEMLRIIRENDLAERIECTSNVSLMNDDIIDALIDYQLDYLKVSIYSPEQKENERITGSKIDVNKIFSNIEKLYQRKALKKSRKPHIAVKLFEPYSEELKQKYIKRYSPISDEVFFEHIFNWKSSGTEYQERYYDNAVLSEACIDIKNNKEDKIACAFPFYTIMIKADGEVNLCCVDYSSNTSIGNVYRDDLPSIWRSETLLDFYRMQLEGRKAENESCRYCEFYRSSFVALDNVDGFPIENLKWEERAKEGGGGNSSAYVFWLILFLCNLNIVWERNNAN